MAQLSDPHVRPKGVLYQGVVEIDLRLLTFAESASHVGPRACMLHVWAEWDGLVSHTSQIRHFEGPYPFA